MRKLKQRLAFLAVVAFVGAVYAGLFWLLRPEQDGPSPEVFNLVWWIAGLVIMGVLGIGALVFVWIAIVLDAEKD